MKWVNIFFLVAMLLVPTGCSAPRHITQAEVARETALNSPQLRSGSVLLVVNPYTCTWVVDRVYRGYLTREQALGNINGRVVFFNDYLFKVELTNAMTYNLENSPAVPNVARIILDSNVTYTVVRYVGWGRWVFQKDYALEVFQIRTDANSVRQCWTDYWNRSECANAVSVATGSNESSYSSLNLHFRVNGTQLGRDAIGALMEISRGR